MFTHLQFFFTAQNWRLQILDLCHHHWCLQNLKTCLVFVASLPPPRVLQASYLFSNPFLAAFFVKLTLIFSHWKKKKDDLIGKKKMIWMMVLCDYYWLALCPSFSSSKSNFEVLIYVEIFIFILERHAAWHCAMTHTDSPLKLHSSSSLFV